jgi:hypothetical protein
MDARSFDICLRFETRAPDASLFDLILKTNCKLGSHLEQLAQA